MNNKVLTVVIPMYNIESYIAQCLDSFLIPDIMDQVEVLVIDDGGKDSSAVIAEKYEEKYPDTYKVIHKQNGGHGSTINKGIELASGKYFKVVDGDDWVERQSFANLIHHLEKTDADMVLSNYHWVDHETGERKTEVSEVCPGIVYGESHLFSEVQDNIFLKMHAITYKTEVIRAQPYRLDEHCFYVDTEYMLFPLPYIKTVSAIPDFVYQYRVGLPGQSMSREKLQKQCSQHERVLYRLLSFYDENRGKECRRLIEKTLARIITSQYKIYLMFQDSHKKELMALEKLVECSYHEIYGLIANPAIILLRRTKYVSYGLVSCVVKKVVR